MAIVKNLPYEVIRFIVEKRSDTKVRNTYQKIADMVKAKFDIEMTLQNVEYHYKRNKHISLLDENENIEAPEKKNSLETVKSSQVVNLPVTEEESKEVINTSLNSAKPKKIDFKALRQAKVTEVDEGFDKKFGNNLSEQDLSSLLNKAK